MNKSMNETGASASSINSTQDSFAPESLTLGRREFIAGAIAGTACTIGGRPAVGGNSSAVESPPEALGQKGISKKVIQAIDVHTHFRNKNPGPLIREDGSEDMLAKFYRTPPAELAPGMLQGLKEFNVGMIFTMGQTDIPDDPLGINESLEFCRAMPGRVKVIATADPRCGLDSEKMRAVKEQLKRYRSDIVAFKCYIGYNGRPEDPGYQPFYKLAIKENLPVMFHTGDFGGPGILEDAHPLRVDAIAFKYPSMRIVICHMGNPWLMEAALVMKNHENVWADLSAFHWGDHEALGAMLDTGELKSIKDGLMMTSWNDSIATFGRYDRLLYGTDVPPPWANYRRFIEALIPEEHHVKVFRKNAEDLFGVKVTDW